MSKRRPLLHEIALTVAPIVVGEALTAVRDVVRREHKAWLRTRTARKPPTH